MKHIIWDWNGTLLADAALSCDITSSMLIRRGKPGLSLEQFRSIMGCPYEEAYRRAGFDYSVDPYADLAAEWACEYGTRWREAGLRPGTAEMLAWIQRRRISQSILTASREDLAREQLAFFGIDHFFPLVMGVSNDLAAGKEHLAIAHMQEAGIDPEDALLIGDTDNDVLTAKAIGSPVLLLSGGHMDDRRLTDTGVPVLKDFGELKSRLENCIS